MNYNDYLELAERLRKYSPNVVAYKLDSDFSDAVTSATDAIENLVKQISTDERVMIEQARRNRALSMLLAEDEA